MKLTILDILPQMSAILDANPAERLTMLGLMHMPWDGMFLWLPEVDDLRFHRGMFGFTWKGGGGLVAPADADAWRRAEAGVMAAANALAAVHGAAVLPDELRAFITLVISPTTTTRTPSRARRHWQVSPDSSS